MRDLEEKELLNAKTGIRPVILTPGRSDPLAGPMLDQAILEPFSELLGCLIELRVSQTRQELLKVLMHPIWASQHGLTDEITEP